MNEIGYLSHPVQHGDVIEPPAPLNAAPNRSRRIANDTIAEEMDGKTGKVVAKHAILWRPAAFRIDGRQFYAFTADGHAYATGP